MRINRPALPQVLFFAMLVIAVPALAYHVASGRLAQGAMALGAILMGLVLAIAWLAQGPPPRPARRPHKSQDALPAQHTVPRDDARLRPHGARSPRDGWIRNGLLAGLIATAAMTLALAGAYVIVVGLAGAEGSFVARWFWALAHNPITQAVGSAPMLTLSLQLALGLAFSIIYAGFAEPRLSGGGWVRGLLFSLALWLLSVVVFLPIVGGGFLGLALGAGPLPAVGNLIVHLVYGVVLGATYEIRETSGLDETRVDVAAASSADRGAAAGLVVGLLVGAGASGLLETLAGTNPLLPPGGLVVGGGLIGAAWGALLGSFVGMGRSGVEPDAVT